MNQQSEILEQLFISGLTEQDLCDLKNQNTFSAQLTLEDINEFFKNTGLAVTDIKMCESDYKVPTIVFKLNNKKYILLYSDLRIAIQDVLNNNETIEIEYNVISIYTLAALLYDSWLYFMYRKFDYAYLLTYPTLGKNTLKTPNYISKIENCEFKEWIISFISDINAKDNTFYKEKRENLIIQELLSIHNSIRRFVITKISNGDIFYISLSDFEIIYPNSSYTKFFVFMYKHFGTAYLQNLREYAINRLNQIEVPRYIEECTKKIDKSILKVIENS